MQVNQNLTISFSSEYTAVATCESEFEIREWWKSVHRKEPFCKLVADRIDGEPNKALLRVGAGFKNEGLKITDIFKHSAIPLLNSPSNISTNSIHSSPFDIVKFIHKNPSKTYEIGDHSYRIKEKLRTQGCHGHVFLASNESNQNVVIKILKDKYDEEHKILEMLAQCGSHPNLPQFFGWANVMGSTWIAMEYIDGMMKGEYETVHKWTRELEMQYQDVLKFIRQAGVITEREDDRENAIITIIDGKPILKLIDFGTTGQA